MQKPPGFEIDTPVGRFALRIAHFEYGMGADVRRDARVVASGTEPEVLISRAIPANEISSSWAAGFPVAYEQDTFRVQAVVQALIDGNHATSA